MSCKMCGSCCSEPGWLVPADWDKIARRLSLSKEEVLKKYLVIDFLADSREGYLFVLAPAKVREGTPICPPGEKVPWTYAHEKGTCIFLEGSLCSIHPDKPLECLTYECSEEKVPLSGDPKEYAEKVLEVSKRREIAELWKPYDLRRYVSDKFDIAHCRRNLEIEEQLLAEFQDDFPDASKISQLERELE